MSAVFTQMVDGTIFNKFKFMSTQKYSKQYPRAFLYVTGSGNDHGEAGHTSNNSARRLYCYASSAHRSHLHIICSSRLNWGSLDLAGEILWKNLIALSGSVLLMRLPPGIRKKAQAICCWTADICSCLPVYKLWNNKKYPLSVQVTQSSMSVCDISAPKVALISPSEWEGNWGN